MEYNFNKINLQNEELHAQIDLLKFNNQVDNETLKHKKIDIKEIERNYKCEIQKLTEEIVKIRDKWHSPKDVEKLLENIVSLKNELKHSREDVSRKKDMIEVLSIENNDKKRDYNSLKEE